VDGGSSQGDGVIGRNMEASAATFKHGYFSGTVNQSYIMEINPILTTVEQMHTVTQTIS
jgi:hypothetical protein